jgi:hypothetical protein
MSVTMRKTLLLSFCCHLGLFSLFNFTFGEKLPIINFAGVSFLGAILRPVDFQKTPLINKAGPQIFNRSLARAPLQKANIEEEAINSVYIKPQTIFSSSSEKSVFLPKASGMPPVLRPPSSVVMLYPRLPQHFLLYFKDRQSVHIELVFNLISRGRSKSIIMNRKISSGNLEADLLSKRYLGHYLFVQQAAYPADSWQTVKIDLSAKEDARE